MRLKRTYLCEKQLLPPRQMPNDSAYLVGESFWTLSLQRLWMEASIACNGVSSNPRLLGAQA